MRLNILACLTAVAAVAKGSPVSEDTVVVVKREVKVVYEDCSVITPKVFIISMVNSPALLSFLAIIKQIRSLNLKPTPGTPMPIEKAALVISLRKMSPFQDSPPSSQTHIV